MNTFRQKKWQLVMLCALSAACGGMLQAANRVTEDAPQTNVTLQQVRADLLKQPIVLSKGQPPLANEKITQLLAEIEKRQTLENTILTGIAEGRSDEAAVTKWLAEYGLAPLPSQIDENTSGAESVRSVLRYLSDTLYSSAPAVDGSALLLAAARSHLESDLGEVRRKLAALPEEIQQRQNNAEVRVLATLTQLQSVLKARPLNAPLARQYVDTLLAATMSAPVLGRNPLPVRRPELAARAPSAFDTVPALRAFALEDIAPAVRAQANLLGRDREGIARFVRDEIASQWYGGARKGALGALTSGAGNSHDKADLLVQLLRASGIDADYIYGEATLSAVELSDRLGVATEKVAEALQRTGIAGQLLTNGSVRIEHVWVKSGEVNLDPFWGGVAQQLNSRQLDTIAAEALHSRYLKSQQTIDFGQFVQHEYPLTAQAYAVALRSTGAQTPELQARQQHTAPLASQKARVRLLLTDGDNVLLDAHPALQELVSQRLTLAYTAATASDQAVIDAFGGLDNTPAYLVDILPRLMRDGETLFKGTHAVAPGSEITLQLIFETVAGNERVEQKLSAGGYHVFGIGAPEITRASNGQHGEPQAAVLLDGLAVAYARQWRDTEKQLNAWLGAVDFNPLPSLVMINNDYGYATLAGVSLKRAWRGVSMDALLRTAEPVSVLADGSDAAVSRQWLRLSALQGSSLEHTVFESLLRTSALSANKALSLPKQSLLTIDAGNLQLLKELGHASQVTDAIRAQIEDGLTVQIVEKPLTLPGWSGSAWRAERAASGDSGYFLSGGLAGGVTLDQWQMPFVAAAFKSAYLKANPDPLSGTQIQVTGNAQSGVVDQTLVQPLSIKVLDEHGDIVPNAPMIFVIVDGTGRSGSGTGSEIETATDATGVAALNWTLGQKTLNEDGTANYGKINESDEYPTRYGVHETAVWVLTHNGAQMFVAQAVALPDASASFKRLDSFSTINQLPGDWVGSNVFGVADKFDNPVANADVSAAADTPSALCPLKEPANLGKAMVTGNIKAECASPLPMYGECGAHTASRKSNALGQAIFNVFVGKAFDATFPVKYTQGERNLSINYQTQTTGCVMQPIKLMTNYAFEVNAAGLSAVAAGQTLPVPVSVRLTHIMPRVDVIASGGPGGNVCVIKARSDVIVTSPEDVSAQFPVSNGGSANSLYNPAFKTWEGRVTTAATPAAHRVDFKATARNVVTNIYSVISARTGLCEVEYERGDKDTQTNSVATVYGLKAIINQITPDPTTLNASHANAGPLNFDITVEPASYPGFQAGIELANNDGTYATLNNIGSAGGSRTATLPAGGLVFDPEKSGWQAQLVLNAGTHAETRSDAKPFRVGEQLGPLLLGYSQQVILPVFVDVNNDRVCRRPQNLYFQLDRPADVTVTVNTDGGAPIVLFDRVRYSAGTFGYLVNATQLPQHSGSYNFHITATDAADSSIVETGAGAIGVLMETHDQLAVGATLVKGVNVNSGVLVHQGPGIAVAGRGPKLAFTPTYAAGNGNALGELGVHWDHNFAAGIQPTGCGDLLVNTGDTGGILFIKQGKVWKPGVGYHATLIESDNGDTYDFYSKNGTRYRFAKVLSQYAEVPQGNGSYQQTTQLPAQDAAGTLRDKRWRLTLIEDSNGNALTLSYEADTSEARLKAVRDGGGREIVFTHETRLDPDGNGRHVNLITRVDGPDGLRLDFTHDDALNLTSIARSGGLAETYTYEQAPQSDRQYLAAVKNGLEATTRYSYQSSVQPLPGGGFAMPNGRVDTILAPDGGSTRFAYEGNRTDSVRKTAVTESGSQTRQTQYTLNKYGAPTAITDPAGTTRMEWKVGDVLLLKKTDARGTVTTWTHDVAGNIISERVSGNGATVNTSSQWLIQTAAPYLKDRQLRHTDGKGTAHVYTYDNKGNLTSETHGSGAAQIKRSYGYNNQGDRTSTIDARNLTTRIDYNAHGLPSVITDPLNSVIHHVYDPRGRLTSEQDAEGRTTAYAYNGLDQRIERTNATSGVHRWAYDALGNLLTETDEEGRIHRNTYDGQSRLTSETNAAGGEKRYTYDHQNNRLSESDWLGHVSTLQYDAAGRLTRRTDALNSEWQYTHDANGNVLTETDAEGRVTTHTYDGLNRRLKTVNALNGATVWTYDGNGNILTETMPNGTKTTNTFDANNRKTAENKSGSGAAVAKSWTFDGNNNLLTDTDGNSNKTTHEYDANNRRTKTTQPKIAAGIPVLAFTYDKVGNLTSETDARGNLTRHDYDALNRRTTTTLPDTDAGTAMIGRTYDKVGNLLTETSARGNIVIHTYDALNRLTGKRDNLGRLGNWQYDVQGNLEWESDGNGNRTAHEYNALNRRTKTTEAATAAGNPVRTFNHDKVGNLKQETTPGGNTLSHDFDALNRRIESRDSLGLVGRWTFDAVGNVLTETDGGGRTVTHKVDGLNRRLESRDALGVYWIATWDRNGNQLSETDGNNKRGDMTYDTRNQLLTRSKAVQKVTYTYDLAGNVASEADAAGGVTRYNYDARNQRQQRIDALNGKLSERRDLDGNLIETIDESLRSRHSTWDLRNRLDSDWVITANGNETTRYGWDEAGNRTQTTRPLGNGVVTAYDSHHRAVRITTGAGIAELAYDLAGNLSQRTDGEGRSQRYEYDLRNQRTAIIHADNVRETTAWDLAGRVSESTDGNGAKSVPQYDARNRETGRTITPVAGDVQRISLKLDGVGNVLENTLQTGSAAAVKEIQTFDNNDRLTGRTNTNNEKHTYTYDSRNNLTQLSSRAGNTSHTYDALSRRKETKAGAVTTGFDYDPTGRLTATRYADGSRTEQQYDEAGRTVRTRTVTGASATVEQTDIVYDANGNRLRDSRVQGERRTDSVYTYDSDDRLLSTRETRTGGGVAKNTGYTYDKAGNRLTETVDQGSDHRVRQYTINARNQIITLNDNGAVTQYHYDGNGNLVEKQGAQNQKYTWHPLGTLAAVSHNNTPVGDYRYNAEGQRVEKQTGGLTRYFAWDGDRAFLDYSAPKTLAARYEYSQGGTPILRTGTATAVATAEYLHPDAMGSVSSSTRQSSAAAYSEYEAFGSETDFGRPSDNKYGFTGHESDKETGLIYAQARYYDPTLGRFISRDAFEGHGNLPASWNAYQYGYNNPFVYTDPDGHNPQMIFADFMEGLRLSQNGTGDLGQGEFLAQHVLGKQIGYGKGYYEAGSDIVSGTYQLLKSTTQAAGDVFGMAYEAAGGRNLGATERMGNRIGPVIDGILDPIGTGKSAYNGAVNAVSRGIEGVADFNKQYWHAMEIGGIEGSRIRQEQAVTEGKITANVVATAVPVSKLGAAGKLGAATGAVTEGSGLLTSIVKTGWHNLTSQPSRPARFYQVGAVGDLSKLEGVGAYREVAGHHVHAKKAFDGVKEYNFREAYSVSAETLSDYGVRHVDITSSQQRLFREHVKQGNPNTLTHHSRIAYQSMVDAGLPKEVAKELTVESQSWLIKNGIFEPVNVPWGKK